MLIDYHIHVLGHRGGYYTQDLLEKYFSTAEAQGFSEIGLTEHDDYIAGLDPKAIKEASVFFPRLRIRLGLEVSYWPGREKEILTFVKRTNFDYLVGSVHHIDSWMFDHPTYKSAYSEWELTRLYQTYFGLVEKLVRSGLFDIVGHLDLIKVFGYRPPGSIIFFAEPILHAIKENGLTVEVNTAGLRKPCEEIYPAREILERCYNLGIAVTLGSDAHNFTEVGRDLVQARDLLYHIGYRKIATFFQHQQFLIHL